MGDAGEGLIDADSRIQERMEELEQERRDRSRQEVRNPEQFQALESLRLARTELDRQLASTNQDQRRAMLTQAIAEIDQRIAHIRGL